MTYRTALVGCGGRGRQHLLALRADPRLEVVALADAKREAAEALAEGLPVHTDHRELLERERPDVLAVALWTDLHLPVLRDAVAAGVRAVLCEKPMARTWGEVREIAALAAGWGGVLTFCHQRRFAQGNRQARALLDAGRFGKIERMDLFSPPHLLDCGTHSVDQALSFHRETPVKWAHGAVDLSTTVRYFDVPAEGASSGFFGFEDGVVAALRTAGPDLEMWSGVRVVGSEGFVEVLWDGEVRRARVYDEPDWRLEPVETTHEAQMVGYVRDAIDGLVNGTEPETSWRHGLRAAEVLFALYESARRRERIDLPLGDGVGRSARRYAGGKVKIGIIGIVGEEAKTDFWGTYARVGAMGYAGVEAVEGRLLDGDAAENVRRFGELGLRNLTTSASRDDLRDRLDDVRRRAVESGADRVSVWWSDANDRDVLLREAELYESAAGALAADGLRLCYHNHDHEFRHVFDGVNALELLAANTKALCFTIDVGWAAVGGADPAAVLRSLSGRVPAIHVKDFFDLSDRASFTAVGSGAVPFDPVLEAAREIGVEWAVVEQDKPRNLSPMDTALASILNLRERGVG